MYPNCPKHWPCGACCDAIATSCYGMSDTRDDEEMWLALSAGESVFIVVDGTANSEPLSGGYELRIHQE